MKDNKTVLCAALIGVVLNIVLPLLVRPMATPVQIKPPNGAANLSFPDQVMHMMVHHTQVPVTSSLIVGVIVAISCFVSCNLCK